MKNIFNNLTYFWKIMPNYSPDQAEGLLWFIWAKFFPRVNFYQNVVEIFEANTLSKRLSRNEILHQFFVQAKWVGESLPSPYKIITLKSLYNPDTYFFGNYSRMW